ncbi:MAG TPA: ABC transporter permease subunit [Ignavibacteria bacterium]
MNRNLFLKEMQKNALSLIIWMIVITLLISATMAVYRTFVDNQSKFLGMMTLIPKGALQMKGISNFGDLLSVLGFYAADNVIYMMVLGSIFSIVLSSNILLKEEYNKTAEYLLTRPLTRSEVFFSKLCMLYLNIFLLNIVASFAGFVWIELVKRGPFSFKTFLILSVYTLLLNVLFGAIGLFMSTLIKRPKPITTFSIGLVLFLYFIYTLSKITTSAATLGYLSPFDYISINVINPAYKLGFWNLLYFIGFAFLLTGISYRLYRRKDIYI